MKQQFCPVPNHAIAKINGTYFRKQAKTSHDKQLFSIVILKILNCSGQGFSTGIKS